jgi:hypothetical protein
VAVLPGPSAGGVRGDPQGLSGTSRVWTRARVPGRIPAAVRDAPRPGPGAGSCGLATAEAAAATLAGRAPFRGLVVVPGDTEKQRHLLTGHALLRGRREALPLDLIDQPLPPHGLSPRVRPVSRLRRVLSV